MSGINQEDLFFISVAARMLGMHPQTLRKYERLGLVQPTRTIGSMRIYSRDELERLKLIKRLVDDGGINLAGVQRLLSIAEVVQRLRPLMRDEALSARDTRRRVIQELDELRSDAGVRLMDFKDYYSTLGVAKTATEKGNQAGVPEAGAQAPSGRQSEVTSPPSRSSRRSTRRMRCSAIRTKRKKYDELGANWRAYEQAGAQEDQAVWRFQRVRPAAVRRGSGWNATAGYPSRSPRTNCATSSATQAIRSRISSRRSSAAARRPRGARAAAPAADPRRARDVEHELTLGLEDAYQRHDAAIGDVLRRAGANGRRADSGGCFRRIARARSGEGEHGAGGAKSGDLYLRIRLAPHPQFERKGRDLYTHVSIPLTTAVLGGEAEVQNAGRPVAAAEDSARHPERSGVPAEGPRDADHGQIRRARRSLRDGRRPAPALADAGTAEALRGVAEARGSAKRLGAEAD